jgi:deoxyribodipyrimidine photolyase
MLEYLHAIDQNLRDRGGRLIIRCGDRVEILPQLVRDILCAMQSGESYSALDDRSFSL